MSFMWLIGGKWGYAIASPTRYQQLEANKNDPFILITWNAFVEDRIKCREASRRNRFVFVSVFLGCTKSSYGNCASESQPLFVCVCSVMDKWLRIKLGVQTAIRLFLVVGRGRKSFLPQQCGGERKKNSIVNRSALVILLIYVYSDSPLSASRQQQLFMPFLSFFLSFSFSSKCYMYKCRCLHLRTQQSAKKQHSRYRFWSSFFYLILNEIIIIIVSMKCKIEWIKTNERVNKNVWIRLCISKHQKQWLGICTHAI